MGKKPMEIKVPGDFLGSAEAESGKAEAKKTKPVMLPVLSMHVEMGKPIFCMHMDIWMDDSESEWEIQESSRTNSGDGKLDWMLRLGRKILVTGIVISSAPLVLPPLIAISAIGFVCSVPCGIFLVSYACTETVMSRLLPMPSPAAPLLLEYRKASKAEEEANGDENQGGQNEVIKGGISIEREEEELKEDTIEEVEMRIELVDKEDGELDKGNILQEESKAEQPIIEEIRSEQPTDEGHGVDAVEGDDKHSSNIEKETSLEAENIKAKEELKETEKGRSCEAAEDKQRVEKAHVDAKVKLLKGNEGTTERKHEQPLIEERLSELPVDEVTGVLDGLKGRARGLSKRIKDESKTDREVDDKQRADRVNVGGVGKQPKEIEVKIEGTTEVKEE
ncbi:hypothetical protein CRYUN_Cryun09bG0164200 [Craigia yunnanensis]